jgi:DNA polymerase-1
VTNELRSRAKAINFGIIYGLSSFALARTLGISRTKASEYKHQYFEKYPEIKTYMEETENFAKENKFVRTILGKKCYIEDIDSSNFLVRMHSARSAINARIQGSAADLIKKAMIEVGEDEELLSRLVLQVHDELVFEIENDRVSELAPKIKNIMEGAIKLSVPITINWEPFAE